MNFIHSIEQRVQLCSDNDNKNLLSKLTIKFQQIRLLDNEEGFNVPTISQYSLKREIQNIMNSRIQHNNDLNVDSKFANLMGGYQSLNEKSYLLLVDVSKDRQQTKDQMTADGGNLDDDKIEREWFQLTILTSLSIKGENDGKNMLIQALETLYKNFINRYKDVKKHFLKKEQKNEDQLQKMMIQKCITNFDIKFLCAPISSGKSDGLSKIQVLELKEKIQEIMKNVPQVALSKMMKSWHCFRLETSSYWTSLGQDKYLVDSSILTDTIHPLTNIQGGRVTKNLDKLEIYCSNTQIYLDGCMYQNDKHQVELLVSYEIELTLRLGKALLIDTKIDSKRILRNLEETIFYKLPVLDKCIMSEQHKQGLDINDGKLIVRNMVIDQDEWIEPKQFIRSKIMDIPLQSLFFALINYRVIMEKYFYLPMNKEILDSKQQFCTLKIDNFEFVHLTSIKGDAEQEQVSQFQRKMFSGILTNEQKTGIREARLKSLMEILDYIKVNQQQRQYFDKNGNRDQYVKFKSDESLRGFHTQVHYFISQHIPIPEKRPHRPSSTPNLDESGKPKSCLKQKTYDLNISDSKNKIDLNYFSLARAPRRQKQRDNHIKTILNQYNTKPEYDKADVEMNEFDSTNGSPVKKDQDVNQSSPIDVSGGPEPVFVKAGGHQPKIKPEQSITDYCVGMEGFKMAGTSKKLEIKNPQRSEDFQFLKKNKVKFNCVDLHVREYQIDPEELEEQKKYSSKYL